MNTTSTKFGYVIKHISYTEKYGEESWMTPIIFTSEEEALAEFDSQVNDAIISFAENLLDGETTDTETEENITEFKMDIRKRVVISGDDDCDCDSETLILYKMMIK